MALTKRNLQELKQAKNLGIHILKKQQAWVNAELDPDKIKNTNTSIYENWRVFANIRPGAVRHNAEWYLAVRDKQTGQIKYSEYLSQKDMLNLVHKVVTTNDYSDFYLPDWYC